MNRLKLEQQVHVARALVEGNSLLAAARMTGIAKMTVEKLLCDLGAACLLYQDEHLRNLKCKQIQCTAIWSFIYVKQENVPADKQGEGGDSDVWTWVAIDIGSRVAVSWLVGDRSGEAAFALIDDLTSRLNHRIQLITDGHRVYLDAVENAFGSGIDYSILVKLYGADQDKRATYNRPERIGCQKVLAIGKPYPKHVSTRLVEKRNLTMRISMRRFTRLTSAFSKKVEYHLQILALHFMYYNFVRIRQTSNDTAAMAAGVADRMWKIEDIVALLQR